MLSLLYWKRNEYSIFKLFEITQLYNYFNERIPKLLLQTNHLNHWYCWKEIKLLFVNWNNTIVLINFFKYKCGTYFIYCTTVWNKIERKILDTHFVWWRRGEWSTDLIQGQINVSIRRDILRYNAPWSSGMAWDISYTIHNPIVYGLMRICRTAWILPRFTERSWILVNRHFRLLFVFTILNTLLLVMFLSKTLYSQVEVI